MTNHTTKICTGCQQELPATRDYFSPDVRHKTGFQARCKKCCSKWQYDYRRSHPENVKLSESKRDKEKRQQQSRERHVANPDHYRAIKRASYAKNPDKAKIYQRRYRKEHPEKVRALMRQWMENNREHIREYRRNQYIKNREAFREAGRRYRNRNREHYRLLRRISSHKRRERIRRTGEDFTQDDLEMQLKSQQGKCWWCGEIMKDDWSIDHLIPISRGGSNHARNIVIAHLSCNCSKGAKMPWEWNGRLL